MTREEFKNLEVGRTFELGYRKITIMETDKDNRCVGCLFYVGDRGYDCLGMDMQKDRFMPLCKASKRKDNKNVIFVEV